jgi:hypothetical protein
MLPEEFERISKTDIEALVLDAISERRNIEYKEQLPGASDEDRREFLADVSSFANAGGGDLIYGVREKRDAKGQPTGIPDAAVGLAAINADGEERRLVSMIRDGLDPRIPGIRIQHYDGFPSGPVIVLRIPKSWASPHLVRFKHSSRFFSRTSAGKYQLDVREIRAAFLASESFTDRISAFRSDRVGKILGGETPVPLDPGPKLVLHLLPIRAFAEQVPLDLKSAQQDGNRLEPMGRPRAYGPLRFNFNGLFSTGGLESQKAYSYLQLFRNGAIEAVYARISREKVVFGLDCERQLVKAPGPSYMQFQKQLGLGPPLFIAITMLSARGFIIMPCGPNDPIEFHNLLGMPIAPVDQDALLTPEVLVEEEAADVAKLIRPALDTIWQASGWPGSQGYDEAGNWVGLRIR